MPMHVTNWKVADIGTAVAAADMPQGSVCKVTDDTTGRRLMTVIGDAEDALAVPGNVAVAMKIGTDANEVDSTLAPARLGDRIVAIKAGDLIMEIREGAKILFTADMLHASLDPARAGATPAVFTALGVSGGLISSNAAAVASGISAPVMFRVHKVFGTDIVVEFLYF